MTNYYMNLSIIKLLLSCCPFCHFLVINPFINIKYVMNFCMAGSEDYPHKKNKKKRLISLFVQVCFHSNVHFETR